MSWNPIGNEGCECLARSITAWGSNNKLERLRLQDCESDLTGILAVMKVLKHCESLTNLIISENNIYGLFTELVKDLDWKIPGLRVLEMEHTGLGEEDMQALASLLHEQLPSLVYIVLGYDISNLQGDSDETLAALRTIQSRCQVYICEDRDVLDNKKIKEILHVLDNKKIKEILQEEEERRRSTDG